LSADYASAPTALPRNSKNVAPIFSFVGEYSAHLLMKISRGVHAIGIFPHGFSNRGENRRAAICVCGAIPNWMGVTS
jgi:hypothetical protein